jgi:hypothetical protein
MTVLESIIQFIGNAASYNHHEIAGPLVILWTDEERLWSNCIEKLRGHYPPIWCLGDYSPDKGTGPGAWLRYQLEKHDKEADLPVIYFPGVGRAAFRSADQCPNQARHLFAVQFQGQFWTQKNGKDWTPFAFLSSSYGGLGLEVASDQETKNAIQECLSDLLEVDVDALRVGKLEAADFRAIVTKDPARTLLRWIRDPEKIKKEMEESGSAWASFSAVCRDIYGFDPDKDGAITAAEKLISGKTAWALVWERYKEAPRAYPGIKERLESLKQPSLFEDAVEYNPRANRKEEERLEADLLGLSSISLKDAIAKVKTLADEHSHRAQWVWATLNEAPLARGIGDLRDLANLVEACGNPNTWEALADYYSSVGWKADRSVVRMLDAAHSAAGTKAVTAAIRTIYLPWMEKLATHIQALKDSYPTTDPQMCRALPADYGTVYLFADGFRMDMAKGLEEKLVAAGLEASLEYSWTALPSVTATAKPAWRPLSEKLGGPLEDGAFQPKEKSNGKALTHTRFKQLMEDLGIFCMGADELLMPTGCAWTEFGNFDHYGHDQGAKLAWRVEEELVGLHERIVALLAVGWIKIQVVTDHGWLMLPGGLPKAVLPKHLTSSEWGRCANPNPGAQHGYPMTAWFWDAADSVVLAPGVSCFREGLEYSHGGLTLQEALIPSLTVRAKQTGIANRVAVKDIKWLGMRLNVVLEGAQGFTVDVRSKVADAATSLVATQTTAAADGEKTSVLIADDDALGVAAFLVVLDRNGQPIFKHPIVVGED